MLVLTKITFCNIHTTSNNTENLAGLKNSVRESHEACGALVGPQCFRILHNLDATVESRYEEIDVKLMKDVGNVSNI